MNLDVLHLATCNAMVTRNDADCTCGALTPEQCAEVASKDAVCMHGRAAGHPCPHCLGINEITIDDEIECEVCGGPCRGH